MNTPPQWIIDSLRQRGEDWRRRRADRDFFGFVKQRCLARANECEMLANYLVCALALGLERMPTTKEFSKWCLGYKNNEEKDDD